MQGTLQGANDVHDPLQTARSGTARASRRILPGHERGPDPIPPANLRACIPAVEARWKGRVLLLLTISHEAISRPARAPISLLARSPAGNNLRRWERRSRGRHAEHAAGQCPGTGANVVTDATALGQPERFYGVKLRP